MNIIWCTLFLIICSFQFSCKNDQQGSSSKESNQDGVDQSQKDQGEKDNEVEIPEDFLSFYKTFHEDEDFQRSHIIFPLQGKSENEKWSEDDWVVHKPFNVSSEFKHGFENMNGVIVESLVENLGRYYVLRRFSKIGGEWHLIYYAQDSNMEGFLPEEEYEASKNIDINQVKKSEK